MLSSDCVVWGVLPTRTGHDAEREAVMQPDLLKDVHKPRADDRPLWDLMAAARGYTALLIAHDLKLFAYLGERPRTLEEICTALRLANQPAAGLLTMLESLLLVHTQNGLYALTPLGADALLESSPSYLGWYLDREIANEAVFSFGSVKAAVVNNSGLSLRADRRLFAHAMHSMSMGAALAWPKAIDLSSTHVMLDVGGGSGAHSIAAALHWPHLQILWFDREVEMLKVAEEFVAQYGVQDRVRMHLGDMLNDPFPAADLHVFSAIYHHWPEERCRLLSAKSFASLQSGGRVIIHERPYNDTRTGPLAIAAMTLPALLRGEAGRYSAPDYADMLAEAGFVDVEVKPTTGYWAIVTGRKP
jgi:trans-aconitate methyltransferase